MSFTGQILVQHAVRLLAIGIHERPSREMMETMENTTRTYRFVINFEVDPGHPAYDDPEWAADAAHGALTNEYGLRATYTGIGEVDRIEK
ncbi:MAG TPA: hypothetical protein VE569_05155 [Acidimicrobiia bacterium]|nr:hypothetical protein [Acidimicrobiia bacterium]